MGHGLLQGVSAGALRRTLAMVAVLTILGASPRTSPAVPFASSAAAQAEAVAATESGVVAKAQQLLVEGKEARRILEPLVRHQRGEPEPLYWLAKANLEEGRAREAAGLARRAVFMGDTVARYHALLGQALWRWTADPDPARVAKAMAAFERAIALDSTSIEARMALVELHLGRPGTRSDSLHEALLVPDSSPGGSWR